MNTSSSPSSSPDAARFQPTTSGGSQSQAPPPDQRARKLRSGLVHWFQQNTFVPRWLPEPLRHPLIGYLVGALLELTAAAIILLLISLFPLFAFRGVLTVVVVVLVALGWGAGPSLFAMLVGTSLLYYAVLSPHFSWSLANPPDAIGLLMYLVVGVSISLLAGRSERARRQLAEKNRLLAQAEASSAADARRLRTVLDILPSAVAIADKEGRLLEVNPALKTLWGEQVPLGVEMKQYGVYKGWWTKTGQRLAAEDWGLARALTRGEVALNEEVEIETFDGQRKTILNSTVPIRDETGEITGGVANEQDITELRRLEREVAERAAELETVFETIIDGIALLDPEGRLVRTNRALRDLLGLELHPENAALPLSERLAAFEIRDEDGQLLPMEAWPATRMLRGEVLRGSDIWVKNLAGRKLAVSISGAPLRDESGQMTGYVEVIRDMTARRELEQRTRDALHALVAMGEAMAHPAGGTLSREAAEAPPPVLIGESTTPLVARRMAALAQSVLGCRRVSMTSIEAHTGWIQPVTMVGLPPDQEQAWWASWSPPQTLLERNGPAVAASLQAGEPILLERGHTTEQYRHYLFQAQTGQLVPMRVNEELVGLMLIDYGDQDHTFSSQEDLLIGAIARLGALVLERDRLLRRWAEARANELALQATKEQMDTFLGIASHELRSPLTALKLALQLTQRRLRAAARDRAEAGAAGSGTPELPLDPLARAMQQVERLERLVNDLLDVARVQADKLDLRPEHTDLAAIVRQAVDAQRQANPDRAIRSQVPPEESMPVWADSLRIEQVVTNYLTNALKYSLADRPVEVGVQIVGQQARVWVRDEGLGLPAEEQERVWERFHRAKGIEVQSGSGVGLGLGLHICRMIVERHQGQVGVESMPGKGSTFWFTLPLASPPEEDGERRRQE